MFEEIFVYQFYFFKSKNSQPFILDVGAHWGLAAHYFKWLYKDAFITCIEAHPETAIELKKNIALNHLQSVFVLNVAVSNSPEPHVVVSKEGAHRVNNSVALSGPGIEVKNIDLSSLIEKPVDLIKLDIEGFEEDVLASLEKSHRLDFVLNLVFEFNYNQTSKSHFSSLLDRLKSHGFYVNIRHPNLILSKVETYADLVISAEK